MFNTANKNCERVLFGNRRYLIKSNQFLTFVEIWSARWSFFHQDYISVLSKNFYYWNKMKHDTFILFSFYMERSFYIRYLVISFISIQIQKTLVLILIDTHLKNLLFGFPFPLPWAHSESQALLQVLWRELQGDVQGDILARDSLTPFWIWLNSWLDLDFGLGLRLVKKFVRF